MFPQSARLRNYLGQQTEAAITIDSVLLDRPGIEYRVGVRVTDSIGQQSAAELSMVRALPSTAEVSIGGPTESEVLGSQSVLLRADVIVEDCASDEPFFYQWRIEPFPSDANLLLNQSNLSIPSGTLEPGIDYQIQLESGLTSVRELSGQAELTLSVIRSALIADIEGGDREIIFSEEMTLDGMNSYDPDSPDTELEFEWTRGGTLVSTGSAVTFASHSLPPGNNQFGLRVRDGDRSATDEVMVFVVGGNPPLLSIEQPVQLRVNPDEGVQIGVLAFALPDANLTFLWKVISPEGLLDLPALETAGFIRFENTPLTSRVSLDGGVLQSGVNYIFRATAVDAQGLEGTVSIGIEVNDAPSVAIVEPTDGARLVAKKGLGVRDIRLVAEAFDANGISQVDFFEIIEENGVSVRRLLGFDVEAPFEGVIFNASPDLYEFVAIAVDEQGQKTESSRVRVEVIEEQPPRILQHPQSQEVNFGAEEVTIQVIAEGSGELQYRWRKNGVNLIDAGNVSGTRTAVLNILEVRVADAGRYTVVVQDDNDAIVSLIGTLDVTFDGVELDFGDDLVDAGILTELSGVGHGSNAGFSRESGEPLHAGKVTTASGWLKWTAPDTGIMTISTEGSDFDTVLAAYRLLQAQAAQGEFLGNELVSNDDGGSGQRFLSSQIRFNVISGTEYHIAVAGSGLAEGNIVLSWNLEATQSVSPQIFGPIIVGQGGGSQLVPSDAQNLVLQVEVASLDDVVFTWFVGGQPVTREVETVDKISTLRIDQITVADVGPYIVRVQNTANGELKNSKPLVLQIGESGQLADAKYSQVFAGVVAIDPERIGIPGSGGALRAGLNRGQGKAAVSRGFTNTQIFNTFGSTTESGEPNHCDVVGGASQWFPFVPDSDGRTLIDTNGSDFDTILAVYTSTTADFSDLTLVACDTDSGQDGLDSALSFQATTGILYFIAVDGVDGATGLVQLNISQVETVGAIVVSVDPAQAVVGGTVA
ncbi:MAG TPA: hypothetical protein EYG38_13070, partial [Verrucomicrobia bacterium]|nr:hypothetical protein [Verrucomicrobiota bacterium]